MIIQNSLFNKYRVLNQISFTAVCNFLTIIAQLAFIPIFLSTLGKSEYGMWVALYSIINWISLVDAGLGSGLRNKLGQSSSEGNIIEVRKYLTTGFYTFSLIFFLFFLVFCLFFLRWDFTTLFPTSNIDNLSSIIFVAFSSFIIIIHGRLSKSIAAAYHYSEFSSFINFLQSFGLILILKSVDLGLLSPGLLNFTIYFLYLCLIINSLPLLIIILIIEKKHFLRFKDFDLSKLKDLYSISWKFLILQISAVIMYSTDAFILQYFYGTNIVAEYGVYAKYYGVIVVFTTIIGAPIWSMTVSEKASQSTTIFSWLKSNVKFYFLILIIFSLCLLLLHKTIFLLWVPELEPTRNIFSNLILLYSIIQCVLFLQGSIINGSGYLFLQSLLAPFAAILNLILSIVGVLMFGFSYEWIVISTIMVNIPSLIIFALQAKKILSGNVYGIWSR